MRRPFRFGLGLLLTGAGRGEVVRVLDDVPIQGFDGGRSKVNRALCEFLATPRRSCAG